MNAELWSILSADSQHARLLRLSFPRDDGPDAILLPNTLAAREELSRCFRFEVELLSDDAHVPLKPMLGKMATVSLVRRDGSLRHFNGFVTEFRLLRADGGFAFYGMVLEPWLAFARLRKDNFSFHGKSATEVSGMTFARYPQADWKLLLAEEPPRMTCANQYDETDYNHLHRRWEAHGLLYWYEHRSDGHTLWLCDRSALAEPIDAPCEVPFTAGSGAAEGDGIHAWGAVRRMVPDAVTLASFDYKRPFVQRCTAESNAEEAEGSAYEVYENTGSAGFRLADDGRALAVRRLEELEAQACTFESAGTNRNLQPGRSFKLCDHFSGEADAGIADRDYLIIAVEHEASNNYQAGAKAVARYSNSMRCTRLDRPWRPGRNHNSHPCTYPGIQTAIVVGPAGQQVHTDGLGRVKVQFHWDRVGRYDENSSPWLRVLSPAAGEQFGAVRLPRVGEEVAVLYLDGNIDHPVILGALYNAGHMPPWQLPDQAALSGARSRELRTGSGQGSQLVFDDTPDQLQAQLRCDHQHSQLSLGHITRVETVAGRQEARGAGWELRTDGHGVARAAKGLVITTHGRSGARGAVKDLRESVEELDRRAREHGFLADSAHANEAQPSSQRQEDVADAVRSMHEEIAGTAASQQFPELAAPHLVLSSPAGIACTAAGTAHLASGAHAAITSARHFSVAAGASFFASVRQSLRLFVQKAGMKLIAAAGDIDMQALTDGIKLLAKLDIKQEANRIVLSAKEEILINGAGSFARFGAGGIELGTKGGFTVHAAQHSFEPARALSVALNFPPPAQLKEEARGAMHFSTHAQAEGRAGQGMPCELFKNGTLIEIGKLDQHGGIAFQHELDADASYELRLPGGQIFVVDATQHETAHEIHSSVGYHGFTHEGPLLTDDDTSIEQHRLNEKEAGDV